MRKIVLILSILALTISINAQVSPPTNVAAIPSAVCLGATSNLNAVSSGNIINWWDSATGGTFIGSSASGTNFLVLPTTTTIYWAEASQSTSSSSVTFNYTGSVQNWTVPVGITSINVDASGAQGYSALVGSGGIGGNGGRIQTTLSVSPGQILNIFVGQAGLSNNTGGWNGGAGNINTLGGMGGGASDIRIGGISLANRVIVAGGGGGSSSTSGGYGGSGGGTTGGNALISSICGGGYGGTVTAGGMGGLITGFVSGSNGTLGNGGIADSGNNGGGGGGGYYGGGGGCNGGGGGGSSFSDPSLTVSTTHTQGYKTGNGEITILWASPGTSVSTRVSVTVVVYSVSISATSAQATPNQINLGMTTSLTVNGGSLGSVANWFWYTGSCGGNYVISGIAPTLSPTVTTTYYVRAEGICNTTPCVTATVFISTSCINSTSANSITGTTAVCAGTSTTLGVNGGSLGTAANWYWYMGSCGGSLTGTGAMLVIIPSITSIYWVRAEGQCNTTMCVSTSVNAITAPVAPVAGTNSATPTQITWNWSSVVGATGYQWDTTNTYPGVGVNVVTSNSYTQTGLTPSTYYTIYVWAFNACGYSSATTLNFGTPCSLPTAPTSVSGNNMLCIGSSTTLTVVGGSLGSSPAAKWCWFTGSCTGTGLGTGLSIVVSPTVTTNYFVRAYSQCNSLSTTSCANTLVTVTASSTTAHFNYAYSGNNSTFQFIDSSTTASGNTITSWNWTFGDGHTSTMQYPTHVYVTTGVYYACLTITDSLGCSDTYCDSVHVTLTAANCNLYVTYTTVDETTTGASDGSINLTANSGTPTYTFTWSNGATTQNISNLTSNYYDVTVSDAAGCNTYASIYIDDLSTTNTPTATLTNIPVDTCLSFNYDSVYVYAVYVLNTTTIDVVWAFLQTSNGTIAYITEVYNVTSQGFYTVSISVTCNSKATIIYNDIIYVDYNNISLNINDNNLHSNTIEIYPNPAKSYITIKNIEHNSTIKLYNISGQLLKEQKLNDIESTIDIKDLSTGVYIIEVVSDKNTTHSKIIKE